MRTLSRPMFNMGGPIKQGIMHGIREPYRGGQRVMPTSDGSRPGYGGPAIPIGMAIWPHIARLFGGQAIKKVGSATASRLAAEAATRKALEGGATNIAKNVAGAGITSAAPIGFKGYLVRVPMVKAALWAKDALMSPASKGFGKSALRFATAPSTLLTAGYFGGKKLLSGDKEITTGEDEPSWAGEGPGAAIVKEKAVLSQSQKDAFAKSQREKRVNKYLDMMGYDRSKKLAIAFMEAPMMKFVELYGC